MQGILNFEFRILNSTALPKANSQSLGLHLGTHRVLRATYASASPQSKQINLGLLWGWGMSDVGEVMSDGGEL